MKERNELIPGRSRSDVDRAGECFRSYLRKDLMSRDPEVRDALQLLIAFRETFQLPLNKTVMGLRSMVQSERPELKVSGSRLPVSQRLKREVQIIWKLGRFPGMKLSRMGDIGGCRAVLPDRAAVDGVVRRVRKNWTVQGPVRDLRDDAAPSGYRAVHIVVVRDRHLVEIQLRTPRQHDWAVTVERTGQRLGLMLKEGDGPAYLKNYFRLASTGLYFEDLGEDPPEGFRAEFDKARELARPYFAR